MMSVIRPSQVLLLFIFCRLSELSKIHKDGYCAWYGVCDHTVTGTPLYCPYNGPAKSVSDTKFLDLLKEVCPELLDGVPDPQTCCDYDQMKYLKTWLTIPEELLTRCPACWSNFRRLSCNIMCSQNQSAFSDVVFTGPQPKQTEFASFAKADALPIRYVADKYVKQIDIFLNSTSADDFFTSCKDVEFPSSGSKAIEVLCGVYLEKCTPTRLLNYLWSTDNGYYPGMVANFTKTDHSPGSRIKPLEVFNYRCDDYNQSSVKCSCSDCQAACPVPQFIEEQLLILALNATWSQYMPYPGLQDVIPFGPVLSRQIFHQVLGLQKLIEKSKFGEMVFANLCLRAHNTCTIHSVLSYYQNNAEHLDRVEYDPSGFWVTADYHDHFLSCVRNPNQTHETNLNMSCLGEFGHAVFPWKVMRGYDDENYNNATALVVTFLMKPPTTSDEKRQLKEWESGFRGLVQNYSSVDNLTLIATTGIKVFKNDMDWLNKEDTCVSSVNGKGDVQIEMNKPTQKFDIPIEMNKPSEKSTQKNGKSKDVMQKATMKD